MLKKRIIFSLLYKDGKFCLSRNFRLQEIGDINWLLKSYNFEEIAQSIDELVVLNLSSSEMYNNSFLTDIASLTKNFFVPITIGGKIRNLSDANQYFSSGADKISLNTIYSENHVVASEISDKYGSQAVVASIDYKTFFEGKILKYKIEKSLSMDPFDLYCSIHNDKKQILLIDHITIKPSTLLLLYK